MIYSRLKKWLLLYLAGVLAAGKWTRGRSLLVDKLLIKAEGEN